MASTPINDQILAGETDIVLTENMTENVVIPADKDITIDLAGFTLSNYIDDTDPTFEVTNTIVVNGTLTLTDSSEDKVGVIDNTNGLSPILNLGTCTINMKSITFTGSEDTYVIRNRKDMTITDCEINDDAHVLILNGYDDDEDMTGATDCNLAINGGAFESDEVIVKNANFGKLTINSGTFTGESDYVIDNRNILKINDGEFTGEGTYILTTSAYGTQPNEKGECDIVGGTFTGEKAIEDTTSTHDSGHVHTNAHTYVSGGSWTLTDFDNLDTFTKPGYDMVINEGVATFVLEKEWTLPEGGIAGMGFMSLSRAIIHNDSIEYEAGGFLNPVRGFTPICIVGCMAQGGCDAYYNKETKKIQLFRNGTEISERIFDVTIVMIGKP